MGVRKWAPPEYIWFANKWLVLKFINTHVKRSSKCVQHQQQHPKELTAIELNTPQGQVKSKLGQGVRMLLGLAIKGGSPVIAKLINIYQYITLDLPTKALLLQLKIYLTPRLLPRSVIPFCYILFSLNNLNCFCNKKLTGREKLE